MRQVLAYGDLLGMRLEDCKQLVVEVEASRKPGNLKRKGATKAARFSFSGSDAVVTEADEA
ncbi:hypothetical protein DIPPA_22569 [Diplonema papillatum]|nr:hypothetical protein DIPPA_22569 [Diplonema papillatum]